MPPTATAATYPASETPFDKPVKLPSGRTYDAPFPFGDGYTRGFGEEFIRRTPGISGREDIGEVLNDGENPYTDGDYEIVIGETDEGNELILRLIETASGLLLVSAAPAPTDYQGERVVIGSAVEKIANKRTGITTRSGKQKMK